MTEFFCIFFGFGSGQRYLSTRTSHRPHSPVFSIRRRTHLCSLSQQKIPLKRIPKHHRFINFHCTFSSTLNNMISKVFFTLAFLTLVSSFAPSSPWNTNKHQLLLSTTIPRSSSSPQAPLQLVPDQGQELCAVALEIAKALEEESEHLVDDTKHQKNKSPLSAASATASSSASPSPGKWWSKTFSKLISRSGN